MFEFSISADWFSLGQGAGVVGESAMEVVGEGVTKKHTERKEEEEGSGAVDTVACPKITNLVIHIPEIQTHTQSGFIEV